MGTIFTAKKALFCAEILHDLGAENIVITPGSAANSSLNFCKNCMTIGQFFKNFTSNIASPEHKHNLMLQALHLANIDINQQNLRYLQQSVANNYENLAIKKPFSSAISAYQDLLDKEKLADVDLKIKEILQKAILYIQNHPGKTFTFVGIASARQAIFNFFSEIIQLPNCNLIIFAHPEEYNIHTRKILDFARKSAVNIENLGQNDSISAIKTRQYQSNLELYSMLSEELQGNHAGRIAIISRNSTETELLGNFLMDQNISVNFDKNIQNYSNNLLKIIDILRNEVDFLPNFINLCFTLLEKLHHPSINKLYSALLRNNEILPGKILTFAENAMHEHQNILQIIRFLQEIPQSGKLADVIAKYCTIFPNEVLNSPLNIEYNTYHELHNAVSTITFNGKNSQNVQDYEQISNISILSRLDARYQKFDKIFLLDNAVENSGFFPELPGSSLTRETIQFHMDLDSVLFCSSTCTIFFKDESELLPIKSYFFIGYNLEISTEERRHLPANSVETPADICVNSSEISRNFSYKKLKCYMENPYDFYIQYILKLQPQDKGFAEMGIAMHNVLSMFIQQFKQSKNLEEIMQNIQSELGKLAKWVDRSIATEMLENIKYELFELLLGAEKNHGNVVSEGSFSCNIAVNNAEIILTARPDLVIFYPDGFEVYDLKTGTQDAKNVTIKKEIDFHSPQLLLYSYVISREKSLKPLDIAYIYSNTDGEKVQNYQSWCEKAKPARMPNLPGELLEFEQKLMPILQQIYGASITTFAYKDITDSKFWYFYR